jgi:hypothetical protein
MALFDSWEKFEFSPTVILNPFKILFVYPHLHHKNLANFTITGYGYCHVWLKEEEKTPHSLRKLNFQTSTRISLSHNPKLSFNFVFRNKS